MTVSPDALTSAAMVGGAGCVVSNKEAEEEDMRQPSVEGLGSPLTPSAPTPVKQGEEE